MRSPMPERRPYEETPIRTMARCYRCENASGKYEIETNLEIENLCAGCATAVIREGLGVLADASGPVANAIRDGWR